jgi:hypothetical protein
MLYRLPIRILGFVCMLTALGCGDDPPKDPELSCDQECKDRSALRGLRETLKLVYNLTLQGNPVGAQDETTSCPFGGSAHLFGEATSNALQGTTEVQLTYELDQCVYLQKDEEPPENYALMFTGVLEQTGTIAVQPTSTTALIMNSAALTLVGAVYDPPIEYREDACAVQLGQSGEQVSGTLCGRNVGVDL